MKLQKALEKAREDRYSEPAVGGVSFDDGGKSLHSESPANDSISEIDQAVPSGRQSRNDSSPPSYDQATKVRLDPVTLKHNRCFCYFPDSDFAEYYKVLRTQIQQRTEEKGWRTIMITSALPCEGKTLTAINLALTFAKAYSQTVLLVDADLRKQDICDRLGFESKVGLGDYLINDVPFSNIAVWPGIEKMTVISGGKTLQESTELLGSPKMKRLTAEMKNRYHDRYILFDVPALLGQADAIAFAPVVDAVLMVVEEGKTSLQHVKEALKLIPQDKFLGFVMNNRLMS